MRIVGSKRVGLLIGGGSRRDEGPAVHPAKAGTRRCRVGPGTSAATQIDLSCFSGPTGQPFFWIWWLPSLGLAVLLLALAGCSSYGPATIQTGAKAAVIRNQTQVADDEITTMGNLESVISGIKDAAGAKAALSKATEICDRMKTLVAEESLAEKNATADQKQEFQKQYKQRMIQAQRSLQKAVDGLRKIPGIPPRDVASFVNGASNMRHAEAAEEKAAPSPSDALPTPRPTLRVGWCGCCA